MPGNRRDKSPLPKGVTGSFLTIDFPKTIQESLKKIEDISMPPEKLDIFSHIPDEQFESHYADIYTKFEEAKNSLRNSLRKFLQTFHEQKTFDLHEKINITGRTKEIEELNTLGTIIIDINRLLTRETIPDLEILKRYFDLIKDTLTLIISNDIKIIEIEENIQSIQGLVEVLKKPESSDNSTEDSFYGDYDLKSIPSEEHVTIDGIVPQPPAREPLPITQTADLTTEALQESIRARRGNTSPLTRFMNQTETPPENIETANFPYFIEYDEENHQIFFTITKNGKKDVHFIQIPSEIRFQLISQDDKTIVFNLEEKNNVNAKGLSLNTFEYTILQDTKIGEPWLLSKYPNQRRPNRLTFRRNTNIAEGLQQILSDFVKSTSPETGREVHEEKSAFLSIKNNILTLSIDQKKSQIKIPKEFSVFIQHQDDKNFILQLSDTLTNAHFIVNFTSPSSVEVITDLGKDEFGQTTGNTDIENILRNILKQKSIAEYKEHRQRQLNQIDQETLKRDTERKRIREQEQEKRVRNKEILTSDTNNDEDILRKAEDELQQSRRNKEKNKIHKERVERAKKFPPVENQGGDPLSKKRQKERWEAMRTTSANPPVTETPFALPALNPKLRRERHLAFENNWSTLKKTQVSPEETTPHASPESSEFSEYPTITYDKTSNTLSILDRSGYKKTFTFKVPVVFSQDNESNFSLDFTLEDETLSAALESENGVFSLTFYNSTGRVIQSLKDNDLPTLKNQDKTPYSKNTQTLIQMIERVEVEKNKIITEHIRHRNIQRDKERSDEIKAKIASRKPRFYAGQNILSREEIQDLQELLKTEDREETSPELHEKLPPTFVQGAVFARAKGEAESRVHSFSSTEHAASNITEAGDDAILSNPELNIYAVFDGVSSSSEGRRAARACAVFLEQEVQKLLSVAPDQKTIDIRLKHIFSDMSEYLESEKISGSTTGTAILLYDGIVHTASIGDSSAFLYRPFNHEGNQIVELMQEDNKISELFREYPGIITKINSILDNYNGNVSNLEQIELPIPDNFTNLQRIQSILEKQKEQGSKTSPAILERQLTGVTTLLQIFNEYKEQGFIPAEKSPEVMLSLFALRSFITDAIRPRTNPNDTSKINIQITSTILGPFDKLLLRTDAFGVLTKEQLTRALEISESPEEFLQNQETFLNRNTRQRTIRSKPDDASCIYVETENTETIFENFHVFEKYIEQIQQEIGAFTKDDFPEFFEISAKYQQSKDRQNFVMAKKYLLEMIHFVEAYAFRCGIPFPEYPVYRESKPETVDLMAHIDQTDLQSLSEDDKNFIFSLLRHYTWGAPKKMSSLVDSKYPFSNIILQQNIKNIFEAIQPFIQNVEIQQLLDNQNLLLEKEENRHIKNIQEAHLEENTPLTEIQETQEEKVAEETQRTQDIEEMMQTEQNRHFGVTQGEPQGHPVAQTYSPLKTQVPTRSWLRSTKARVAAAFIALGQLINSTYSDNTENSNVDPTTIASFEKEPQIGQPNIEIISSPSTLAREADMQMAAPVSLDSYPSALDAGLLVKIPPTDTVPDFEVPDLGLTTDMAHTTIEIANPNEADASITVKTPTPTPEKSALDLARDAVSAAAQETPKIVEIQKTPAEIKIQKGEGVTQAILRDLKARGVDATKANVAVLNAAKGRNFTRIFELGSLWNYSYDKDTNTISDIQEGPTKAEATKIETPKTEALPFISNIGQFNHGDPVRYLNKTTGSYEDYTIKTDGIASGSVALVGKKIGVNGKTVKFQFALTKDAFEARCLPKDAIEYKAEKIAIQKINDSQDRIIFTAIDGGIISSIFHYLVAHIKMTATEAFKTATDLEKQRDTPATNKNLTYTWLPDLIHIGDFVDISHTTDEKGKKTFKIDSIHKQHTATELPKKERPTPKIEIEDPFAE